MGGWLKEIVDLYDQLSEVVALGSVVDAPSEHQDRRKRPASPALVRLDAWAMTRDANRLFAGGEKRQDGSFTVGYLHGLPDIWAVMQSWASMTIESLNWTTQPPYTVSGCCALLIAQTTHIATQPFVDDFDAEMRWVRGALMRCHGLEDPKTIGTCFSVSDKYECGGRVWRQPDGPPKCDSCGRVYSGTLDAIEARFRVAETRNR